MDDAELRGAAPQKAAFRLYARDVLLLAANGDGRQSRSAGIDLQDDQRRNAALLLLRLSALGYGFACDDLRSAVPLGGGKAQYSRRQCAEALQARAELGRVEAATPRCARRRIGCERANPLHLRRPRESGDPER